MNHLKELKDSSTGKLLYSGMQVIGSDAKRYYIVGAKPTENLVVVIRQGQRENKEVHPHFISATFEKYEGDRS